MKSIAAKAIGMLGVMTLLTGILYPLTVTACAQVVFPQRANGSLLIEEGRVRGSALIGQSFTSPKYFWGRLSATSPAYNGGASAGSNLGPTSEALTQAAQARISALRAADPGVSDDRLVPVDLVTASGSGLDPHITPAAAELQAPRVARARGLGEDVVRVCVAQATERPLGFLSEPTVNVLQLNLALDARGSGQKVDPK